MRADKHVCATGEVCLRAGVSEAFGLPASSRPIQSLEKSFMPNYNTQAPPYSTNTGDVALAFNNESPTAGQASQQFALPSYSGFPENGRTIRWQTIYASSPSAVSVALQSAMVDSDTQYTTIDTSTAAGGEARTVTGVRANFVRAKVTSITGGSGVTVQFLT